MKNKILVFTIIIITSILTANISAHVVLDYPVGGENFQAEDVITIQWHVAIYHGLCNWDLYFSSDGGTTWVLMAENLAEAQLSYDWTVLNTQTNSGRVRVIQDNNTGPDYDYSSGNFSISTPTGFNDGEVEVKTYQLSDAYPNPFNPSTTIRFSIPSPGVVKLTVFNTIGEEVSELVNDYKPAGNYQVEFSADALASGTYFYRIETASFIVTKKMVLQK